MPTKRLGVAICTYNRADVLGEALQGLCVQTANPDTFEVVVIDNASTDNTHEVVAAFKDASISLRYVYEETPGLSRARNRALEEIKTEFIAYLDDDAVPDSQWITSVLETFDTITPVPAAVGGKVLLRWNGSQPDWLDKELFWIFSYLNYGENVLEAKGLVGCNLSFHRELLVKAGGFNVNLGRLGNSQLLGEETQVLNKLYHDGCRIYYQPKAVVEHIVGQKRQSQAYVIQRCKGAGQTQAFMRTLDGQLNKRILVSYLLREVYYQRATLVRAGSSLLLRRRFLSNKEKFLLRCKLIQFEAYEKQLLRFLVFGIPQDFQAKSDIATVDKIHVEA